MIFVESDISIARRLGVKGDTHSYLVLRIWDIIVIWIYIYIYILTS